MDVVFSISSLGVDKNLHQCRYLVGKDFDCIHMEEDTDENAVLAICLGNVSDNHIQKKHTIFIDNIVLEEAN